MASRVLKLSLHSIIYCYLIFFAYLIPFTSLKINSRTQRLHTKTIVRREVNPSYCRAASADTSSARNNESSGIVLRLAARKYHPEHSRPNSRKYTTRKESFEIVQVNQDGVVGDYNHYRTIALSGTLDRAISILTTDTLSKLNAYGYHVQNGDLGENILVDAVDYRYFKIGERYHFASSSNDTARPSSAVIVEITEPIIPCANLCKLPYINNESKSPRERIASCQTFLDQLTEQEGLRGWYARIIQSGSISVGATLSRVNKV